MAKVFKEFLEWTQGKTMPDGRPFPDRWGFYCPGCHLELRRRAEAGEWLDEESIHNLSLHMMNTRDVHGFNGDPDSPTFTPSIMARGAPGVVCHSFVTDGRIQYLGDCTHPLAGQTVALPDIDSI